jgi:hypothetical protein
VIATRKDPVLGAEKPGPNITTTYGLVKTINIRREGTKKEAA